VVFGVSSNTGFRRDYLFSANGAASSPAWGDVPGILTASERALKATHRAVASIPYITSVILDVVFAQQLAVFFLKGAAAMVFLLGLLDESRFQRWLVCVRSP
jgi:hypothetical protein